MADILIANSPNDICETLRECQALDYIHKHHRELFFENEGDSRGYADDATWIMTSAFIIFTMQTGFGLVEMGSCQAGHEVNILLKNVVDVLFGSLAYYLFGYAISFGEPSNAFMGMGDFAPTGHDDSTESGLLFSRYIFQMSFAATATTIVSGCVAMRMSFFVYCAYAFSSIFIYAFPAHWIWASNGWLAALGVHDFAGGGPVHLLGGTAGLIGTLFLGPRTGRFDGTRPEEQFLPVSPTSILFGLFMLWWGWIGFNCGSTFGVTNERWIVTTRCAITTINATAAGGIFGIMMSMATTNWKLIRPEDVTIGILGALVSITPCCDCVNTYDAFPIGAGGAMSAFLLTKLILRLKIDDPVSAIGVHVGGSVWGLLSVGIFSDNSLVGIEVANGLFYGGGGTLLWKQAVAIVAIASWSATMASIIFYVIGALVGRDWHNPRKGLRVSVEKEIEGADSYLHGVAEWQQEVGGGRSVASSDMNPSGMSDFGSVRLEKGAVEFPGQRPFSMKTSMETNVDRDEGVTEEAARSMNAHAMNRTESARNTAKSKDLSHQSGIDHPYRNYKTPLNRRNSGLLFASRSGSNRHVQEAREQINHRNSQLSESDDEPPTSPPLSQQDSLDPNDPEASSVSAALNNHESQNLATHSPNRASEGKYGETSRTPLASTLEDHSTDQDTNAIVQSSSEQDDGNEIYWSRLNDHPGRRPSLPGHDNETDTHHQHHYHPHPHPHNNRERPHGHHHRVRGLGL